MGDKKSLYTGPPPNKVGPQPPKKTLIEVLLLLPQHYRTNLCVCCSCIMSGRPRLLGRMELRYTCVEGVSMYKGELEPKGRFRVRSYKPRPTAHLLCLPSVQLVLCQG